MGMNGFGGGRTKKVKKEYFRHKKLLPGVNPGRREERVCRVLHMHELGGQELAVGGLCMHDIHAGRQCGDVNFRFARL